MKYKLETGLGAFCEREIENILSENECSYKKESNKMGAAYEVETRAPFIDACVEAVLDFYKQRELLAVLGKKDEMEHFAILGTLLSVERESEKEEVKKLIQNETAVNLDGLYTFNLSSMRESWQGIGKLCARLYASCESDDDKNSLILYLLDLQERRGRAVAVKEEGIFVDGEKKRTVSFYGDREKDLTNNIFLHRPEVVEVDANYKRSLSLENFLRRLYHLTAHSPIDWK